MSRGASVPRPYPSKSSGPGRRKSSGTGARGGRLHDRAARGTPPALAHNLRYNKVLHEHVITLLVTTLPVPHVPIEERITVRELGHGVSDVVVRYGFMEDPNIPEALALARDAGLELDESDVTYFLGRETLIATKAPGMALWRERLFVLMARNAGRATASSDCRLSVSSNWGSRWRCSAGPELGAFGRKARRQVPDPMVEAQRQVPSHCFGQCLKWNGTLVTTTLGLNKSAALISRARWLWNR